MDLITKLAENANDNIKDAVGAITGKDTNSEPATTESFYVRTSHRNAHGTPVPNSVKYGNNVSRWYRPAYYYPWYYPTYSYPYYMPYYSSYPTHTVKYCPDCGPNEINLEFPRATNVLLLSIVLLMMLMIYRQ